MEQISSFDNLDFQDFCDFCERALVVFGLQRFCLKTSWMLRNS